MWYNGSDKRHTTDLWDQLPGDLQRQLTRDSYSFRHLPLELRQRIVRQTDPATVSTVVQTEPRFRRSTPDPTALLRRIEKLMAALEKTPPRLRRFLDIVATSNPFAASRSRMPDFYHHPFMPDSGATITLGDTLDSWAVSPGGPDRRQYMTKQAVLQYMSGVALRAHATGRPLEVLWMEGVIALRTYKPPSYEPDEIDSLLC